MLDRPQAGDPLRTADPAVAGGAFVLPEIIIPPLDENHPVLAGVAGTLDLNLSRDGFTIGNIGIQPHTLAGGGTGTSGAPATTLTPIDGTVLAGADPAMLRFGMVTAGVAAAAGDVVSVPALASGVADDAGRGVAPSTGPAGSSLAGSGLIINLVYDAQALAAPQSFRDGMRAAADLLQAAIHDNITVNISVGYGEFKGQALSSQNISEGDIGSSISETYSSLRGLLASHETSTADTTSVNALPNTTTLNGMSNFFIGSAEAKALGVVAANSSAIDGYVGIGKNFTGSILVGGALHEITHAMGRIDGTSALSLFRYTSAGHHLFTTGPPAAASYFSIDGGATKLADFGVNSDPSDFLNSPASSLTPSDPFDETIAGSTLTSVDLTMMDVLGFNLSASSDTTPPALVNNSSPSVTFGATLTITSSLLQFDDNVSGHAQETYSITNAPLSGTLLKSGAATSSFTQADIDNALVTYHETAGGVTSDSFSFKVTDAAGNATAVQQFQFQITRYSTTAPLMTNTNGTLDFDQVVNGKMLYTQVGGIGPEWELDGSGGNLLGDGVAGFLMRNTGNVAKGQVDVGEVVNGAAVFTPVGGVDPRWQFDGNADFLGDGRSQFLIRNTGTAAPFGQMDVGEVKNGAATFVSINVFIGSDWQFGGTGDFRGAGKQGFLMRSSLTGQLDVGEVTNGTASLIPIGGVDPKYQFKGVGDFFGDGHTGFLIRNSTTGQVDVGELVNNTLTFTNIAAIGADWEFVGTGKYLSTKTDFLLRNTSSGALDVGSVSGAVGNAGAGLTVVGGVGPEWNFHSTNVAVLP